MHWLDGWAAARDEYRAAGKQRFYDMSDDMRREYLAVMVKQANGGCGEADRQFATGWLDAHCENLKNKA